MQHVRMAHGCSLASPRPPPLGPIRSRPAASARVRRGLGMTAAGASHVQQAKCRRRPMQRAVLPAALVHSPPLAQQRAVNAPSGKLITTRLRPRNALVAMRDGSLSAVAVMQLASASAAQARTLPRAALPAAPTARQASMTMIVIPGLRAGCAPQTRSALALGRPSAKRARKAELLSGARPSALLRKCQQVSRGAPQNGARAQRQMAAARNWLRRWRLWSSQPWAPRRFSLC